MARRKLWAGPHGHGDESSQSEEKRMRTHMPQFAAVTKKDMLTNSFQNVLHKLEPMLRRVVQEEVERGVVDVAISLQRSPRVRIKQQPLQTTTLQLWFSKKLSLPIFTGTKIEAQDNTPLEIMLVGADQTPGRAGIPAASALPKSIRVEVVAIEGDFPGAAVEDGDWTSEAFERKIVREREGKRPLLTGDVSVTLRNGLAASVGDLMFTDNSSWIKSRHFRIGARVARGSCEGLRIKEAITERFTVKDQRGEVYKKHYPPALSDEVWRLTKIGRDGSFHGRLAAEGIVTIQDFLKLWAVDPKRLRKILGQGMSDKMWAVTLGHARTCVMNRKLYLHRRPRAIIVLNPICEVVRAILDGYPCCSPRNLVGPHKALVEKMRLEAYSKWDELEEVDETFGMTATTGSVQNIGVPAVSEGVHESDAFGMKNPGDVFKGAVDEPFPVVGPAGGTCQDPPSVGLMAAMFQNDEGVRESDAFGMTNPRDVFNGAVDEPFPVVGPAGGTCQDPPSVGLTAAMFQNDVYNTPFLSSTDMGSGSFLNNAADFY